MQNNEKTKIMKYLTLLELDNENKVDEQLIQKKFRELSFTYHPDLADEKYKDGKRFVELQEAREYLISNITYVNKILFNKTSNRSYYEEQKRKEPTKADLEKERRKNERIEIGKKLKNEILENIDRNSYRPREYSSIISLINEYVNEYIVEYQGTINYQTEYEILMSEVKKVKKKRYFVGIQVMRFASLAFVVLLMVSFFTGFFIGPILKYLINHLF